MNITNDAVTEYINGFYEPLTEELGELRRSAEAERVPIILKETETFLRTFLLAVKPARILEIGCAVGYSAMFMAELTGADVVTVEKSHEMYVQAVENIERLGYGGRIRVIEGDGEEAVCAAFDPEIDRFDLIFIDAAKSHYKRFLDAALRYSTPDTVIISDNILFKARVASDEYDPSGKYKTNIKRLREFNEYIMGDSRFTSTLAAIGDGIAITKLNAGEQKTE